MGNGRTIAGDPGGAGRDRPLGDRRAARRGVLFAGAALPADALRPAPLRRPLPAADAERREVRETISAIGGKYYDGYFTTPTIAGPTFHTHHAVVEWGSFGVAALA